MDNPKQTELTAADFYMAKAMDMLAPRLLGAMQAGRGKEQELVDQIRDQARFIAAEMLKGRAQWLKDVAAIDDTTKK